MNPRCFTNQALSVLGSSSLVTKYRSSYGRPYSRGDLRECTFQYMFRILTEPRTRPQHVISRDTWPLSEQLREEAKLGHMVLVVYIGLSASDLCSVFRQSLARVWGLAPATCHCTVCRPAWASLGLRFRCLPHHSIGLRADASCPRCVGRACFFAGQTHAYG